MSGSAPGGGQMSAQAQDQQITNLLLTVGEDMIQPIASGSFVPNGSNNVVNIPMRQVGLTKGFLVNVKASFANSGASAAPLQKFGAANVLSNITLTDLDNYQRINCSGLGLNLINTAKEGFPFAAALLSTATDTPNGYGNNYSVQSATATLAASTGTGTVNMWFWVPCSYGKRDLRGAIFTGVVNATAFLQFTLNPAFTFTSGDGTLAVYGGTSTAVTYTGVTYTVYQNYIDQIPRYTQGPQAGAPILPPVSMRTQYRIVSTSLSAISASQDFPIPFSNFQSFLSAMIVYDQNGTLNAGTDINYWKLAAANTLVFTYLDPFAFTLRTRVGIMTDPPAGAYMWNFRDSPVNTNQAGNMQILMNPSSAAAQSQVLVTWESFAEVNSILGAQSLPAS